MAWHIPRLTRRRFLFGSAALVSGAGIYAWRIEPHWLRVIERDLPIAHLPENLIGKKLVHISDLHVGNLVDSEYLIGALQHVSALEPDLTVITGDFMSYESSAQFDEVVRVLSHLHPGPLGCIAVLGNHDYGRNWSQRIVADELCQRLADRNIVVLRNETRSVAGLHLTGIDDLWSPCFEPQRVLPLDAIQANLVLCHNPDAVDLPIWSGYAGWILSGHTHGGQCKPPFLPPPMLPVSNRRYTSGEFELDGGRRLYINCGLGYLRRVRFNVRPEITVFRLMVA